METVDIRLTTSITTAAGSLGDRSGVRLRLDTDDGGLTGSGGTAPIPGAPDAISLEDIASAVRGWAESAPGRTVAELLESLDSNHLPPPARFAAHTALADIAARDAGLPLCQWLRAGCTPRIHTNSLISQETPKDVHAAVSQAVADGVRAVKLKVGAAEPAVDATRIIAASEAGGTETDLRLDANRSWTKEQTIKIIGRVGPYRIDYVEDPTPNPMEYGSITAETGVAMAIDVTPAESKDLDRTLERTGADVLVVKAAAAGGIDRIIDTSRSLDQSKRLVVSSSIDGPIGLLAGVHAAAALPSEGIPHGLATATYVRGMPDLLLPVNGSIALDDSPGLSALDDV